MDETQKRILDEASLTHTKRYRSPAQLEVLKQGRELSHKEYQYKNLGKGENAVREDGLYNDCEAQWKLKQETPYHRRFLDLTIQGLTKTEIAKLTGFSEPTVANTLRQPWARDYILKESKKTVSDEIKQLLEQEAIPSLKILVAVRDNEKARASDRVTASNALLDRFLGKPTQPISNNAKPPSEMSDDELRAQVQAEIVATQPN